MSVHTEIKTLEKHQFIQNLTSPKIAGDQGNCLIIMQCIKKNRNLSSDE